MKKYHGGGVYNPRDISALSLWLYHPAKAYMDTGLRGCLFDQITHNRHIVQIQNDPSAGHTCEANKTMPMLGFFPHLLLIIHPFVCGYKRRYADQILHYRDLHSCQLSPVHVVVKLKDPLLPGGKNVLCVPPSARRENPSHLTIRICRFRRLLPPSSVRLNTVASMYRFSLCLLREACAECASCAGNFVGVSCCFKTFGGLGRWTPCTRMWCCSTCWFGWSVCLGRKVTYCSHTDTSGQFIMV